ncbi:hypothetical protein CONPUDRAFT_156948 [Coniophora puteana RWD-64-598 SS2]|uniref:F-box domain-containing protein n=1 Tax=Coniophora puteana (strain RWD-64-598) TaxID=741705 RepID=A0A5M3MF41_CONPW|nr:uncharacterized protein CONPUDRAFT_156948 [Coniophora puteana RWD-64-598 SS2]EIW77763.1 hypothetical protein CONPUDRAFT_156948 [Coniophora puteana RWD-64-598 SS2]
MHKVFYIREVVDMIFREVRGCPWTEQHPTRALAILARTCRAFHDVALNMLWEELDDLSPLIRSLPEDVYSKQSSSKVTVYRLRKALNRSHWATLMKYARFVRRLGSTRSDDVVVDVPFMQALCHPPSSGPLLENLRHMCWTDSRREAFPLIRSIAGSRLASLRLETYPMRWGSSELSILTTLPHVFPSMELVFIPEPYNIHEAAELTEVLCGWNQLQVVTCGTLTTRAILHFARLASLFKLSFRMPETPPDFSVLSIDTSAFHAMKEFMIDTPDIDVVELFLCHLHVALEQMSVYPASRTSSSSLHSYFTTLASHSSVEHMSSIVVHQVFDIEPPRPTPDPHAITLQTLFPLTSFPNLTSIFIDIDCPINLSDACLDSLASAWPHLESLSLNETGGWRPPPGHNTIGITPHGLLPLLSKCPHLTSLSLHLTTASLPASVSCAQRPGRGTANARLDALNVCDSPITHTAVPALSAFLSDVLPNLHNIFAWHSDVLVAHPDAGSYRATWREVELSARNFARVREQEKRWHSGERASVDAPSPPCSSASG